jgi:hypothetical protein
MTGQLHRRRELLTLPAAPPAARFAFPLRARTIGVTVPTATCGSYLLLDPTGRALYVGRSDACLRRRLLRHPLRGRATHFTATVTDTPRAAYLLECYWWHRYQADAVPLLNLIHPAATGGAACPFCDHPTASTADTRRLTATPKET